MNKDLNVLLLVDAQAVKVRGSKSERPCWSEPGLMDSDIFGALRSAGCKVRIFPLTELEPRIFETWKRNRIDLIFNLARHWKGDRRQVARITALLDLLQIPYTGSGPQAILRASDKYVSKHIAQLRGVEVPAFCLMKRGEPLPGGRIRLPTIVEPRFGGSEGITERSLVRTRSQLQARVNWIHRVYNQPAVCEEFAEGREITVGVIGNESPVVSLPRERLFPKIEEGGPQFAIYRVKRDQKHSRAWDLRWEDAGLSRETVKLLQGQTLILYKAFGLRDYARFDFRLTNAGAPVFLEANHNPECGRKSQFFVMFQKALQLDYETMVLSLAALAMRGLRPLRPRLKNALHSLASSR